MDSPISYADNSLSGKGYVFLTEHISGDSVIELNRTYGFRTENEKAIAVFLSGNVGQSYTETIRVSVYAANQTSWTPYENICPISGWTGAKVTRTGKNLLDVSDITDYSKWSDIASSGSMPSNFGNKIYLLPALKSGVQYTISFGVTSASFRHTYISGITKIILPIELHMLLQILSVIRVYHSRQSRA